MVGDGGGNDEGLWLPRNGPSPETPSDKAPGSPDRLHRDGGDTGRLKGSEDRRSSGRGIERVGEGVAGTNKARRGKGRKNDSSSPFLSQENNGLTEIH